MFKIQTYWEVNIKNANDIMYLLKIITNIFLAIKCVIKATKLRFLSGV